MAQRSAPTTAAPLNASHRIVVLHGKERFLHGAFADKLIAALESEHGEIGIFRFDGAETTLATVLDEVRSYGLMQSHKLVIVDQADQFMAEPKGAEGKGSKGNRPAMERYAQNPVDHATLLFRAETWRPGKFDAAVKKVGAIIKCEPYSDARAATWCVARGQEHHGVTLERAAANLLVERLGPGLTRLDTEIEKLAALAAPGKPITATIVREITGRSREEQAWDLQGAVLTGRPGVALEKVRDLLEVSQTPKELLMWALLDLIRKLHAASQMLRSGVSGGAVAREVRLWGASIDPGLKAARRHGPHHFAQLLRAGIRADWRMKTGLASSLRSLEGFTVTVADRLK